MDKYLQEFQYRYKFFMNKGLAKRELQPSDYGSYEMLLSDGVSRQQNFIYIPYDDILFAAIDFLFFLPKEMLSNLYRTEIKVKDDSIAPNVKESIEDLNRIYTALWHWYGSPNIFEEIRLKYSIDLSLLTPGLRRNLW